MRLPLPSLSRWRLALVLLLTAWLSGCADLGYYLQSIDGQLSLNAARRPVSELLEDPATTDLLKRRLERAMTMRDFASRELRLPDNGSYRSYADLQRPFVVWNVFAAEEFSIEPRRWCFPFAGCVGYRGYFSQKGADDFAAGLRAEGLDVYVGGVPAYSTLGWFEDPLLNTFINYPDHELARLIFHELAHQVVYIKGDTTFNESFAVAVETAGVERWIAQHGNEAMRVAAAQSRERRAAVAALLTAARDALAALYQSPLAADAMRARKADILAQLQQDYARLKQTWNGFAGYDGLFAGINNARLASFALYNDWLPQFQHLLEASGGNFDAFYAEVKRIGALPPDERSAALRALAPAAR